jgi:hypothetical protein
MVNRSIVEYAANEERDGDRPRDRPEAANHGADAAQRMAAPSSAPFFSGLAPLQRTAAASAYVTRIAAKPRLVAAIGAPSRRSRSGKRIIYRSSTAPASISTRRAAAGDHGEGVRPKAGMLDTHPPAPSVSPPGSRSREIGPRTDNCLSARAERRQPICAILGVYASYQRIPKTPTSEQEVIAQKRAPCPSQVDPPSSFSRLAMGTPPVAARDATACG